MPHSFRTTNNIDDVKKLHGSTLQNVSLMSTVLVSKKKISQRYCVLTLGFPSNPNIKLQPGDHINVFPENEPQLVRQVIKRLSEVPKENEIVVWKECDVPPSTLKKALTCFLDLGSPLTPDRMLDWIQFSYDDTEKDAIQNLCEDNISFQEWRSKRPNILDLLMCFPSLRIPAAGFVASLSKLMPRAYSIASVEPKFTLVGGQNIPVTDLVLEVMEFETGPFLAEETEPKMRKGVASNFLTRLPIGGKLLSYHHSNAQFKMPNDPNVPVIMISAGSGIAPFRAFWQQRMIRHYPKSSAWLYFGCRDVTENMFSDETSKFVQRRVAFSRIDRDKKEYVQDLIEQDCAQVYDLISNHQAHIYICGKVAMALDVKEKLLNIFISRGQMNHEESLSTIQQMRRTGRLMEEYFG